MNAASRSASGARRASTSAGRSCAAASCAAEEVLQRGVALEARGLGRDLALEALEVSRSPRALATNAADQRAWAITQRSSDSIATAVARSADDRRVVPGPGEVLDARRAGQRHRGHDQQPFGEADLGGAVEQLAGDRDLAVGLEQAGLQREQHEAAPRRRCPAVLEPAVEHGVRLVDAALEREPVRERRRGQEGHAGVVLGQRHRAPRPFDGLCALEPRAGHERSPLGDRRGEPDVRAAALPRPVRAAARRSPGRPRTSTGTPTRCHAAAPSADRRVRGQAARGPSVAGVQERFDGVEHEPLAIAGLGR